MYHSNQRSHLSQKPHSNRMIHWILKNHSIPRIHWNQRIHCFLSFLSFLNLRWASIRIQKLHCYRSIPIHSPRASNPKNRTSPRSHSHPSFQTNRTCPKCRCSQTIHSR
jgi:hypothetical protein